MKRFIKYFAPLTSEDVITSKTLYRPAESTDSNVTDVILVTGAGLDKPIAYVRLEPMEKPKSTEEPTNEKIDATADTDFTDWDEPWTDAPGDDEAFDGDDGFDLWLGGM